MTQALTQHADLSTRLSRLHLDAHARTWLERLQQVTAADVEAELKQRPGRYG